MSDADINIENEDIKYLERFISENNELEELETIVNEFNIFTSLGIQYFEIRHSNFLSWLLVPSETHGLGDYYLKIFLKRIIKQAQSRDFNDLSIIDVDFWDLEHVDVRREWNRIDIIIIDDQNKFVCVIENKIGSKEHGDQLQRYFNTVNHEFPDYKKLFVYLNIEGDIPESDEDKNWIPFSYNQIVELLEYLINSKKSNLGDEVTIFIQHYVEMLRRYIVKDSKVEDLCRRIYKAHERAIDLIIEHKPDRQEDISQMLQDIIEADDDLILDISGKSRIRFISKNLDFIPKIGDGWTRTKRILLFELQNSGKGINIKLYIGPAEIAVREKIFNLIQIKTTLIKGTKQNLTAKWTTIYSKSLIKADKYENIDDVELRLILDTKIQDFKKKELPNIEKELLELKDQLYTFKNEQ